MRRIRVPRLFAAGAAGLLIASGAAAAMVAVAPSAFAATGPGGGAVTFIDTPPFTNGQNVGVQGAASAFSTANAGTPLQIEECRGTEAAPPTSNTACDATTLDSSSSINTDGSFIDQQGNANGSNGFTIKQLSSAVPTPANHTASTINCDSANACVLYIGVNQNNFSQPHAFLNIPFALPPATLNNVTSTTPVAVAVTGGTPIPTTTVTINYGTATDSNAIAETITGNSTVVTGPAAGSTVTSTSPGVFKYTPSAALNTAGGSDSFTVAGATVTCGAAETAGCTPTSLTGNQIVVNVTISAAPTNFGTVADIIQIPVTPGVLTMSGSGTDVLNTLTNQINGSGATEACGPVNGSGQHVLTGQPFFACGALTPITVVNPGTDHAWTVTGTVTDFLNGNAAPGTTCDTKGTFSPNCIPAGNLQWGPVAAVGQNLVPGDVGNVTAGPALPNIPYLATVPAVNAALAGSGKMVIGGSEATAAINAGVSTGWIPGEGASGFGLSPAAGLNTHPAATLCSATSATTSNGTYICGADLEVAVPASASGQGSPYQATLTLTLT